MQRLQLSLALGVLPEFAKQMTGLLILLPRLSVMEGQMTVGMLVAYSMMTISYVRFRDL